MTVLKAQFFSIYYREILAIMRCSFLRCKLFYFVPANISWHRYDLFFRFISLLSRDINVNSTQRQLVNNKNIPVNIIPFYNCDEMAMPSKCDSSDCCNKHDDSNGKISKKKNARIFYVWISAAYYAKSMKFVSLELVNQKTRFICDKQWNMILNTMI